MRKATTLRSWYSERTVIPPAPEQPKSGSKKNTRKWCRGRVGVKHQLEWMLDQTKFKPLRDPWMELRCTTCHKKFSYCTGWFTACICGHHPGRD